MPLTEIRKLGKGLCISFILQKNTFHRSFLSKLKLLSLCDFASTVRSFLSLLPASCFMLCFCAAWKWSITETWHCPQRDEVGVPTTTLISTAVDSVEPTLTWTQGHVESMLVDVHKQSTDLCTYAHTYTKSCKHFQNRIETHLQVYSCISLLGGTDLSYSRFSKLSCRDLTCFRCPQRNC